MFLVVSFYLALPTLLAVIYAFFWPTVLSRAGLFITLGSLVGIAIALGALYWTVVQPFVAIGIARARPGERAATFLSLVGTTRLLAGATVETGAVCLTLAGLAHWLRR